jgi:NAD(P)H-hydrate repair Nnr-like enzyme with NAD(P)H-hydrate epimerase domain
MEFNDRRQQHLFQDIGSGGDMGDASVLADHLTDRHGVDPDAEGWSRDSLVSVHRQMHS